MPAISACSPYIINYYQAEKNQVKSENRTVQHSYGLLSYFIYIFLNLNLQGM